MKSIKLLLLAAALSVCALAFGSTAYTVDPNVDLVAVNKSVTFCVKHVHLQGMVDVQMVALLHQASNGDWIGDSFPAAQIDEAALKTLGPVGYINSLLAPINAAIDALFAQNANPTPVDIYAALDAAFKSGFKYVVDANGVVTLQPK